MFSKLPMIWKQTVAVACDEICSVGERQGAAGIAAGQGGGCDFELSIGTDPCLQYCI